MTPAMSFNLDVSTITAFQQINEAEWDFNIFSINVDDIIIDGTAYDVFNYFVEKYKMNYRVFYGSAYYLWKDDFSVRFESNESTAKVIAQLGSPKLAPKFKNEIIINGFRATVTEVVKTFAVDFADKISDPHRNINWIIKGRNGPETVSMPVKNNVKYHKEMYPVLGDPEKFVNDFLTSKANVLILMGDPGLGKSSFVNWIIQSSRLRTSVVYDSEVMQDDTIYASFIDTAFQNEGGLMVLEDADTVLRSRDEFNNRAMAKLLNISDGIIDSSKAKFIFTTNIRDKGEIDPALTRPGRCFDVVEFRQLTYNEALIAAEAIGKELVEKDVGETYSIAEIFNNRADTNERAPIFKTGFI